MSYKTQIAILKGIIFGGMFGVIIGVLTSITSGQSGAGIGAGVSMAIACAIGFSIQNIRKLGSKSRVAYMRPPNCYLCERGLDTEGEFELIYFTKIPSNIIKSMRGSNPNIDSVPSHSDNAEWFCMEEHSKLAKQFKHLTYEEATDQLRCITGVNREDSQNITLDDLFMSECTLCGDMAGWTGIIEEEEFGESIELGVLMHCNTCANSFLDIKGALQEYLTKSPPVFIPGRRLSNKK